MKYLYKLLFLCLLLPNIGLAQINLVHNPSFEDTTHCPVVADTSLSVGWYSCGLSPDYYNSCANSLQSSFGVPSNWMGYQQPLHGDAYIGLGTFDSGAQNPIREFAGAQLVQPLVPGTKYYVSGFVAKASISPYICNTNKFGFRFFTQPNNYLNPPPVDNFAHVYSDVIVNDTSAWVQLHGSFLADSVYKYIILGNFFDDVQTTITGCNTTQSVSAYYYIDKVCVSTDSLTCEVTTAISPLHHKNAISVAPNPAQDLITISFSTSIGSYDVSIFNLQGREVLTQENIATYHAQLNISHLDNGLFFLKVSHNNQSYMSKLLKQ